MVSVLLPFVWMVAGGSSTHCDPFGFKISIISNHVLSMESNENTQKRSLKLNGKTKVYFIALVEHPWKRNQWELLLKWRSWL
jgi:hypothetical protein